MTDKEHKKFDIALINSRVIHWYMKNDDGTYESYMDRICKCNTQFIAHYRDKRFDFRDGDYVKCPICGQYIDWNIGIKQ